MVCLWLYGDSFICTSLPLLNVYLQELFVWAGKDLSDLATIIADVSDEKSLQEMCSQAKVILNCVGPVSLASILLRAFPTWLIMFYLSYYLLSIVELFWHLTLKVQGQRSTYNESQVKAQGASTEKCNVQASMAYCSSHPVMWSVTCCRCLASFKIWCSILIQGHGLFAFVSSKI